MHTQEILLVLILSNTALVAASSGMAEIWGRNLGISNMKNENSLNNMPTNKLFSNTDSTN
jgi:hypothetical protein